VHEKVAGVVVMDDGVHVPESGIHPVWVGWPHQNPAHSIADPCRDFQGWRREGSREWRGQYHDRTQQQLRQQQRRQ